MLFELLIFFGLLATRELVQIHIITPNYTNYKV